MEQAIRFLTNSWLNYLNGDWEKAVAYLSPIQGEEPGWYIWPREGNGVYEMQLLERQNLGETEETRFILKHYPYPEEEAFERLASAEQVVRLSDYFDNTPIEASHGGGCACSLIACRHQEKQLKQLYKGIPRCYHRKSINPSLFSVGEIKLRLQGGKPLRISLVSQDRLVLYSVGGVCLEHEGSRVQLVAPGSIDREVLGWTISWQFFDVFLKEILARMGYYPHKCRRESAPGMIYYQEEGGEIRGREDTSVTQITHTFYF